MSNEPMVSVIIPIYKSENVMDTAINSVLNQSYDDFELLLIDDGSPDNSLEKCKEWSNKDSRIKVFHKENGGICSARNYGIRHAIGKYIAFLDHDDEFLENCLSDNITLLESSCADYIKFETVRINRFLSGKTLEFHSNKIIDLCLPDMHTVGLEGASIRSNYELIKRANKMIYIWDGIYNREFLVNNSIWFNECFKYGHEDIFFNFCVIESANKIIFNSGEYYQHNYAEGFSTSSVFKPEKINDAKETALKECDMLLRWNWSPDGILEMMVDHYYIVLGVLRLKNKDFKLKQRIELTNYFSVEVFSKIPQRKKNIKKLFKKRFLHGLLAFLAYKRLHITAFGLVWLYNTLYFTFIKE